MNTIPKRLRADDAGLVEAEMDDRDWPSLSLSHGGNVSEPERRRRSGDLLVRTSKTVSTVHVSVVVAEDALLTVGDD